MVEISIEIEAASEESRSTVAGDGNTTMSSPVRAPTMGVVRLSTRFHLGERKFHVGERKEEREAVAARAGESR
jgi:alpha-D-ribose 1-methylphosphonate 5-triphosphate synthase subunit PhnG